jgi:molybdopterin molybdotransferase
VRPVVRRLAGHADVVGRRTERATLTEGVTKSPGRRAFLRVRLERDHTGDGWLASLAGGQSSHVLSALAQADGLAIVSEEVDSLPVGSVVEVILLERDGC